MFRRSGPVRGRAGGRVQPVLADAGDGAVPDLGMGQGAGAVQRGPEASEEGGVAELDVGQLPGGALDPSGLGGYRPGSHAMASQRVSSRSRNPVVLSGAPPGAMTASMTTACMMSALYAAAPVPVSIIWYSSTARSCGGRSHRDRRASSGQIATRWASAL